MMRYNRGMFDYDSTKARKLMLLTRTVVSHHDGETLVLDEYNGILRPASECDVEHCFTLFAAWNAGFKYQFLENKEKTLEKMREFANNPINLIFVGSSSNRSRGSKSLWDWSPLCLAFIPQRNDIIRYLAALYDLVLTTMQKWAMAWADEKILKKYKHGILLGKTRTWLIDHGFYVFALPIGR